MKILHVITSLTTGGAEKLMVDLLPRFRDLGHDVELLIFNGVRTPFYKELESKGIKIHTLMPKERGYYSPLNLFAIKRFLKGRQYDIIHTHNTAPQLFVAASGAKSTLVTTEHNTTNRRRNIPVLKPVDRWMYSKYSRVVCISKEALDCFEQYIGKDSRYVMIPNGVDLLRFSGEIPDIERKENFIITMVAAFRPQKDQDSLIRAIASLPDCYSLRLVGDGVRRPELESLASELGVGDRVVFCGVRSDIPELLSETDIVVMSSHYEGLSLSSVEGMASGRPFIASDVPGLHDVVNGAGVLFPHGDAESLANEIRRLCENADDYRRVAEACQAHASQYSIEKTAEEYDMLYRNVIK